MKHNQTEDGLPIGEACSEECKELKPPQVIELQRTPPFAVQHFFFVFFSHTGGTFTNVQALRKIPA